MLATAFAEHWPIAKVHAERMNKLTAENTKLREELAAKPTANGSADAVAKATQEFKEQPGPKTEAERKAEQFDEAAATDDELKAHFAATKDLRDQFSSAPAYVAHVRHPPKR
jgi:hypothetical protein